MKLSFFIPGLLLIGLFSCKNKCMECELNGEVQEFCERQYSDKDEFKAEQDTAEYYGWTCAEK